MENKILDSRLQEHRLKINEIIKELHQMTIDIKNEELSRTVSDLRERINEPFMFVICGEVKAGKSSFINALLDTNKDVCKVAPDPCTDTIQQIIYGEEEKVVVLNDFLKKIMLPVEILRDVAIVDTPGTNTISDHHQEVTERFIPGSDLIVFVFEAKNPYRQSAWDFFDFIHSDWRKKVIFVLQQADLMEKEDLIVNEAGVLKYAKKKGIEHPNIFSVSAKLELAGQKEESGFKKIRAYIQENITGGQAPVLKLINNLDTSLNVSEKIGSGLKTRKAQFDADVAFRQDVKETLDEQEKRSKNQVGLLVENLLIGYDKVTNKYEDNLRGGLGFLSMAKRTFMSMFSNKEKTEDWFINLTKELEREMNDELHPKLNSGVHDIAESIQQMAKLIDLKIKNSTTILKDNHEIFGDIADRRSNVLRDLQEEFANFMDKNENFMGSQVFSDDSISPNIATGSGIAVVGMILATVAQGAVFDITGGLITTFGVLFAGATVRIKRKKIVSGYQEEVKKGRVEIEREISSKLNAYIDNIKLKIGDNFDDFDALLELEKQQITEFDDRFSGIQSRLSEVGEELKISRKMTP